MTLLRIVKNNEGFFVAPTKQTGTTYYRGILKNTLVDTRHGRYRYGNIIRFTYDNISGPSDKYKQEALKKWLSLD